MKAQDSFLKRSDDLYNKISHTSNTSDPPWYLYFLIGFICCVAVYYGVLGGYNVDEIEAVHTAWKISVGERIYEDFFQHHHPLLYYLLVPVIKLGGESLLTLSLAELFAFAVFAAMTVIAFLLARRIYDVKTALISIILLLSHPFFIKKGTEIRPDILQTVFGLASFYLLTIHMMDGGKRKYFVASAIFLSLSFLALQKAIFLVSLIGAAQLYWLWKGKITKKDFLFYWSVFLILPVAWLSYLLASGTLGNYFDLNWLLNMKYLKSFFPLKYFSLGAGLFLLFIHGCFLKSGSFHGLVVFLGAGLLASIFLAKMPFSQWFLPALPFVSMVAACSLLNLFKDIKARNICLTIFVLFCAGYLIRDAEEGNLKKNSISNMEYVLSVSEPGEAFFFVGHKNIKINLFRKDVDFFWFCTEPKKCLDTYQSFREYDYDPASLIKKHRPRIVFVHHDFEVDDLDMKEYDKSPEYKRIYIRRD